MVAFDVGGGLAIRDDEDLFVFAGAFLEDSAGELKAEVEVGEVLGGFFDLIDGDFEADLVIINGDGFGHA